MSRTRWLVICAAAVGTIALAGCGDDAQSPETVVVETAEPAGENVTAEELVEAVTPVPLPTEIVSTVPLSDVATTQPVVLETPVSEPQPTPTFVTPAATPTEAPTLTPLPPATFRPLGAFATWWEGEEALQAALGLARIEQPAELHIAWQPFENGLMIWRSDDQHVYALLEDGSWESYQDTFTEGDVERDNTLSEPQGLLQPVRGFGAIWRDDETLQSRIGWGTDEEAPAQAAIQFFDKGFIIRIGARVFAVYDDGTGNRWVEM